MAIKLPFQKNKEKEKQIELLEEKLKMLGTSVVKKSPDPFFSPKITEKIANMITINGNTYRLSNITESDSQYLIELVAMNSLLMDNSEDGTMIIDAFLNLKGSINGWIIEKITAMTQGHIPDMEEQQ